MLNFLFISSLFLFLISRCVSTPSNARLTSPFRLDDKTLPYYHQFQDLQDSIDFSSYSLVTLSYRDSSVVLAIKFNTERMNKWRLARKFHTSPTKHSLVKERNSHSSTSLIDTVSTSVEQDEASFHSSNQNHNVLLHYFFNKNFLVCFLETLSSSAVSSSYPASTSLYNKCQDLLRDSEDEFVDLQAWELAYELSTHNHLSSLHLSPRDHIIPSSSTCLILNLRSGEADEVRDHIFKLDLIGNIWRGNGAALGYHSDTLLKKLQALSLNQLFRGQNK